MQIFQQVLVATTDWWLLKNPDLSPPHCFLWAFLRNSIYTTNPASIDDLKQQITKQIAAIDPLFKKKFFEPHKTSKIMYRKSHIKNNFKKLFKIVFECHLTFFSNSCNAPSSAPQKKVPESYTHQKHLRVEKRSRVKTKNKIFQAKNF